MARLKLDEVRKKKGITKYAFAKALELEPSNVQPFFKPGYNPKLKTMSEWAAALGCKISDLFDESKDRPRGIKKAIPTEKER